MWSYGRVFGATADEKEVPRTALKHRVLYRLAAVVDVNSYVHAHIDVVLLMRGTSPARTIDRTRVNGPIVQTWWSALESEHARATSITIISNGRKYTRRGVATAATVITIDGAAVSVVSAGLAICSTCLKSSKGSRRQSLHQRKILSAEHIRGEAGSD